jgi:hypothetical protein
MKIIFLDIDGVLNIIASTRDEWGACFQEPFVTNLRKLIEATGAKIVLSSTWRFSGLKEIQRMWKARNLPGEVIAITPMSNTKYLQFARDYDEVNIEETLNSPRGCEIEWWLNNNGYKRFFNDDNTIKSYVIIDDDKDMLYEHKDNFVVTSNNWDHEDAVEGLGFTSKCLQQAISILNS